jgi:alpha-L-fucosidase
MRITKFVIPFILTLLLLFSCVGCKTSEPNIADTLKTIDEVSIDGPFLPNWESLAKYQIPEWYKDAKFGIFIHWGVYSVPGYGNEWYPREMYNATKSRRGIYQHHLDTYGKPSEFGYKDFIPQFKAEKFDAAEWAQLFKDAGAKYVIPVAEHHDGFPMYDSDYTEWSAAKMGPKRDIIGELSQAVREEGLTFGLSSHRVENWWFYEGGRKIESDVTDERNRGLYGPARDRKESEDGTTPPDDAFLQDWLLRCCELVDKYEPQVIWFDWWIAQPAVQPYLKTFSSYYYNQGAAWDKGVAINYKKFGGESFPDTAGVLDIERGGLAEIRDLFWQTDTSVSKTSWGYVTNHQYKTVNSLIDDLIDIVSKNGCMLLNIGPKPDGTIPQPEQEMLLDMGKWLQLNGAAIYGTRPWHIFGEGPTEVEDGTMANDAERRRRNFGAKDIRFTTQGDSLYVIGLEWPADREVVVRALGRSNPHTFPVEKVRLLGHRAKISWKQTDQGLVIQLPAKQPCDYAFTLKIN